jgi:non-specific serine/threonine protein kinase/serine/threonine-protein kinase
MERLDQGDWRTVQALFEELVDLPPETQSLRLTGAPQSPSVIDAVRNLLLASRGEGILDMAPPLLGGDQAPASRGSLAAGQAIGGFTIDRPIGCGGLGEVYLAHRTGADFDQRVALKLLRVDAAERAESFARERRLLARLDHPGIARLIDAGIAPDGRPYIAMDYVDGQPIDAWCAAREADLDTRLNLFRDVCDAVAYAHGNLVVHRDIKPSNILIDAGGKPRLLDFGIGKLLGDSAALPATTQAMLTPEYAAPEQLDGDEATVATDIYALGVLLYELVSGRSPWRGGKASVPMMIRRVLYEDADLPSRAAAEAESGAAPVPARRIAGDLDAIVMKAMRRDPAQRYRSVSELAEDIGRHQQYLPVHARDGSTRYMVGRFLRRYRWGVAAAAAVLAALLVGAGGIAWQARQTAIERDLAVAEARRSEAINRMLTVMMRDTAEGASSDNVTVKQMLDQTADRLAASLDTSAKSADLVATLFDLYVNLEDTQGADALVRKALARGIGRGDPVATAQLRMRAAAAAGGLGRTEEIGPNIDAAEPVFLADPAHFRRELVEINIARAQLWRRTGRLEDAIALLVRTLPDADVVYAENHRDLLTTYNNLLVYMSEANQLDAMPAIFDRAEAVIRRTGQQASMQGLTIAQLKAVRLLKLDQAAAAERIVARVAAARRATFGRSAGLAVDLLQLGRAKLALGKYAEARTVLAEAWPMAAEYLSPRAAPTLIIAAGLIEAQAESGDLAGARRTIAETEPLIAALPAPGLPQAIFARAKAVALLKEGRRAEARQEADRAETLFKAEGAAGASYLKSFRALRARLGTDQGAIIFE